MVDDASRVWKDVWIDSAHAYAGRPPRHPLLSNQRRQRDVLWQITDFLFSHSALSWATSETWKNGKFLEERKREINDEK